MTDALFPDDGRQRFIESYVLPIDLPTELGETPLRVSWKDIYRFDPDVAEAALDRPEQFAEELIEGLQQCPGNVDVDLDSIDVEIGNVPTSEYGG